MRTIAIRVEDELHEQLTLLARIAERPLVDEIREAIDEHIVRKGKTVDLAAQAHKALEQIDADAASRRKAIESLLKKGSIGAPEDASTKGRRKGGS